MSTFQITTITTIASTLAMPARGAQACAGTAASGGVDTIVRDRHFRGDPCLETTLLT